MTRVDLIINSADRAHGTPSDFSVQLHRPVQVRAIKLKRSIIPNTIHTINANNQILRVENGSPTTKTADVVLTAANYTAAELAAHIAAALTSHSDLSGTFTAEKDSTDSYRFIFTCTQGFSFHFTNDKSPFKELGFERNKSYTSTSVGGTNSLIAPNFYKLGYDYLLLQSRGLQSNMETTNGISCFAQLPMNANSGGYAYNSEDYDGEHQIYETQKTLNYLDFRLINPYNQLVDMNGVDISLIFEVTQNI